MAVYVESVDDFYLSALSTDNQHDVYPISDSIYADELQLQEALVSSAAAAAAAVAVPETAGGGSEAVRSEPVREIGESSGCFCEICVEKKESDEMLRIDSCSHSFCFDCITKQVTFKLQDNVAVVNCLGLGCDGVLEFDTCRPKMPDVVAARWDEMLCESVIPAGEKFYCPFKNCSALLVRDAEGQDVTQSECPHCHRLFCAKCNVGWHAGFECGEIQKLNEDEREREDLMALELARSNSWMRCPTCRFFVEKTEGCPHMICRCGFEFCYSCGATWTPYHGGCQPARP